MREFTVKVPDRWFAKVTLSVVVIGGTIALAFFGIPYFLMWIEQVSAEHHRTQALYQAETKLRIKKLLGECRPLPMEVE